MEIAIVIPCYNRSDSLKRLLNSLDNAIYKHPVDLIFSIDYSGQCDVMQIAQDFKWKYGNKKIIAHTVNIGLKANILSCGDLTSEYEGIILLEDDLIVSPVFFEYASKAALFYKECDSIAGISLYSYEVCEIGNFNFYPLIDDYDTYFIQWPSSWGQLWTRRQWQMFRDWLKKDIFIEHLNIPDDVKIWTQSWKKYFIAYMVDCNKYFVYPYKSYSNEIGKGGVHHTSNDTIYSVNMYLGKSTKFLFRPFFTPFTKYDCFFQPMTKSINIGGQEYEVTFDLHGTKMPYNIKTEYVITPRDIKKGATPIKSFPYAYIPLELNISQDLEGDFFHLASTRNIEYKRLKSKVIFMLRMPLKTRDMIVYVKKIIIRKLLNIGRNW